MYPNLIQLETRRLSLEREREHLLGAREARAAEKRARRYGIVARLRRDGMVARLAARRHRRAPARSPSDRRRGCCAARRAPR